MVHRYFRTRVFKFSAFDCKFQNSSCSNARKIVLFFLQYFCESCDQMKVKPCFGKILADLDSPRWTSLINDFYSCSNLRRGLMLNPSNKSQIFYLWQSRIKKWSSAPKNFWSIKSCMNTLQSTLMSGWKAFKESLF